MATPGDILIGEELSELEANAQEMGWQLIKLEENSFLLGVPAKDGSTLHIQCKPDDYPTRPPAWRWCCPNADEFDTPAVTPIGGQFFHSSGVICAPWNSLAYRSVDPRGPHSDWTIGAWKENPKTRQCRTLSAMAIRIAVEAQTKYQKRKG